VRAIRTASRSCLLTHTSADPFADRAALDANPFADPSVQGALAGSRTFEADDDTPYGHSYASTPQPKGAYETDDPYGTSGGTSGSGANARAEELRRREQELERREAELANRAENIRKHGRNNWPFCECGRGVARTQSWKPALETRCRPEPLRGCSGPGGCWSQQWASEQDGSVATKGQPGLIRLRAEGTAGDGCVGAWMGMTVHRFPLRLARVQRLDCCTYCCVLAGKVALACPVQYPSPQARATAHSCLNVR
jgi:hypothetical protein